MHSRATALVPLLLLAVAVARADEWPAPVVRNVFSPNGQYFVRIIPGTTSNLGVKASTRARGEFYARRRDRSYGLVADVVLQNPVSPAYATVTNDGHLVTYDDWFTLGFAHAIVFYRPNGQLLRQYAIEDLYSADRLPDIPRSVSSRWWRCGVWYTPSNGNGQDSLSILDYSGGSFQLDPQRGTFTYQAGGGGQCEPGRAMTFVSN
jgi:hypothetical protein